MLTKKTKQPFQPRKISSNRIDKMVKKGQYMVKDKYNYIIKKSKHKPTMKKCLNFCGKHT